MAAQEERLVFLGYSPNMQAVVVVVQFLLHHLHPVAPVGVAEV
jgi:hypothetical protein